MQIIASLSDEEEQLLLLPATLCTWNRAEKNEKFLTFFDVILF